MRIISTKIALIFVFVLALVSCRKKPSVEISPFGTAQSGEQVSLFHITNSSGAYMDVIDYGCRIVRIGVPDREGKIDDVVVGVGSLEEFEAPGGRFYGPVIGRYANRIDNASIVIDSVRYELVANENYDGVPVSCHGGIEGFDRMMWDSETFVEDGRAGVRFRRLSPDGEQGFPGNCCCVVTYSLTDDNTVRFDYEAATDKPTVVNLSNHTYLNMKGSKGGYVMDHLLQVEADSAVQNNLHFCPDLILPVQDSPFDFRTPHRVDYRLDMENRQLAIMHGMSACWQIRNWDGTLRKVADLYDRQSGRGVQAWSTEPALLTYTGRNFDGETTLGKYGPIEKYGGMLLETIHFADSPNQKRFPSTELRPSEKYHSVTEFRFYAR